MVDKPAPLGRLRYAGPHELHDGPVEAINAWAKACEEYRAIAEAEKESRRTSEAELKQAAASWAIQFGVRDGEAKVAEAQLATAAERERERIVAWLREHNIQIQTLVAGSIVHEAPDSDFVELLAGEIERGAHTGGADDG